MTELDDRYKRFLDDFATLYSAGTFSDDESCRALVIQLHKTTITSEDWDLNGSGGHFYFETPRSAPRVDEATFDAIADDADGIPMNIILHTVDGLLNWGEWFRLPPDGPTLCWPPTSLRDPQRYRY